MKSNLFFSFAAVLAFVGMSFTTPETVETYSVDTSESKVEWIGRKVTGKHNGYVNLKSGSLQVEDGVLKGGSFVIDMTTITVTDLQAGKGKEKLEGHLMAPDFFNVAEHKTATFTITRVLPTTEGEYQITGELDIKGNKNKEKFLANVKMEGNKLMATAEGVEIDRSEYDVRYGSGSFFENLGDKTIYDDFILNINLVASK